MTEQRVPDGATDGSSPPSADDLRVIADDVARAAGALLRSYAGRADLQVDTKSSATDPVSAADRAAERLIVERLRAVRPDDGIVGEEQAGDREGASGLRWVVDPLDGTVNFLYGIPQWCVSVAVEDGDGPLAGAVYDPGRDELFSAARGRGATLDDTPLHIDPPSDIADALVATGFSYEADARADWAALVARLVGDLRDVRRFGSAALDLCWLAAGRWDGYVEFTLNRWDWSAGSLLVTEAGGTVSQWELPLGGAARRGLAAGGSSVHDHLAAWLGRHGAQRHTFGA